MSGYFWQRIKNIPMTANNSNTSRVVQPTRPITKSENIHALSDDELLTSVLEFEQTPQFKQAEEQAQKVKGENIFVYLLNEYNVLLLYHYSRNSE